VGAFDRAADGGGEEAGERQCQGQGVPAAAGCGVGGGGGVDAGVGDGAGIYTDQSEKDGAPSRSRVRS